MPDALVRGNGSACYRMCAAWTLLLLLQLQPLLQELVHVRHLPVVDAHRLGGSAAVEAEEGRPTLRSTARPGDSLGLGLTGQRLARRQCLRVMVLSP